MSRILVAEDDRMISLLVCSVLRRAGHEVAAAGDVPEAIELAHRAPRPDALVLDLHLPQGTGADVVRALRASPETAALPVLVLSGTIDPESRCALESMGVREMLAKPVNVDDLVASVGRLLAGQTIASRK